MQICIAVMGQELTFAMFEQWKTTLALQPEYGNPVIGQHTGVTWPITPRGLNQLLTLGVHSRSQVRQKAKIGLNQSLMNITPFPNCQPGCFYLNLFNSEAKKKKKKEKKNPDRDHPALPNAAPVYCVKILSAARSHSARKNFHHFFYICKS